MSAAIAAMNIGRIVEHALSGVTDRNVVIGPPLWRPDGAYFIVAASRAGFFCRQMQAPVAIIEEIRDAVLADLKGRPALIAHDLDDEAKTIQACCALWPCEETAAIAKRFETEKAFAAAKARGLIPSLRH